MSTNTRAIEVPGITRLASLANRSFSSSLHPQPDAGNYSGWIRTEGIMTGTNFISLLCAVWFRWKGTGRTQAVAGIVLFLVLAPPAAAGIPDPGSGSGSPGTSSALPAAGETLFITLPGIVPNDTPGFFVRQYTFSFQQENITIRTNVSAAVYYGAKNGDKFATTPSDGSPEALAPGYYRAFINDPAQEALYTDLLGSFRTIRQEHRYTDDEYAELLSVFVESLPFDNQSALHPDTLSRFPAETLVDGTGDCDDKSVLLAGLLSREGYNVSLLLFIPEHHMAVGMASDCLQFNDTGYLYIETTGVSFMGEVPKRFKEREKSVPDGLEPGTPPLTSPPLVIRAGSGSKKFTKAGETGYILMQKAGIDNRIALLKEQLTTAPSQNTSRFLMLAKTYNAYAEVHNYIGKHRYDRAGTYRYLIAVMQPVYLGQQPCAGQRTPMTPAILPASVIPVCGPAGSCISTPALSGDSPAAGYLPCLPGIRASWLCQWQNLRQALVLSSW
jgi:hypothetical protein